jgi:hypothetical protein
VKGSGPRGVEDPSGVTGEVVTVGVRVVPSTVEVVVPPAVVTVGAVVLVRGGMKGIVVVVVDDEVDVVDGAVVDADVGTVVDVDVVEVEEVVLDVDVVVDVAPTSTVVVVDDVEVEVEVDVEVDVDVDVAGTVVVVVDVEVDVGAVVDVLDEVDVDDVVDEVDVEDEELDVVVVVVGVPPQPDTLTFLSLLIVLATNCPNRSVSSPKAMCPSNERKWPRTTVCLAKLIETSLAPVAPSALTYTGTEQSEPKVVPLPIENVSAMRSSAPAGTFTVASCPT